MPVPYGTDSVCRLHSPFPIRWSHLGSVMIAGNNVWRQVIPKGGPLDFNPFPLIAAPLQTNGLWHCWASMLTFLIGTLVFTRLALSGAFERQKQWLEENKYLI